MENSKIINEQFQSAMNVLGGFEDFRKEEYKKYKNFIIKGFISIFLAVLVDSAIYPYICLFVTSENPWPFRFLLILFICLISFPIYFFCALPISKKKFQTKLKEGCFKRILNVFGDIKWSEHSNKEIHYLFEEEKHFAISDSNLSKSGLFITYMGRITDDEFEGNYKGVDFKISEICLKDIGQQEGGKRAGGIQDVFKGVIIQFDSNKKVLNRTIVSTKADCMTEKNKLIANFFLEKAQKAYILLISVFTFFVAILITIIFGQGEFNLSDFIFVVIFNIVALLSLIFSIVYLFIPKKNKKDEPLNKVTLEDPEFNKRFDVYSSDQIEARYLITPSFMERLNNLTTAFGTKKVKCSFFDDKFMIAISTKKDLFEIGKINKPLTDPENLETFYSELNSIYQMIDYFKLDEKTGL